MRVDMEHFLGAGDVPIHLIHTIPHREPKAEVVIVHGYSDHGERKGRTIEVLGNAGFRLHCADHRGHGRSGGMRGYFDAFDEILEDVEAVVQMVRERAEGRPVFLIGDSMGAIATGCVLARQNVAVDAAAFGGLPLIPQRAVSELSEQLGRVASRVAPHELVKTFDPDIISRDKAYIADYLADPLVYYASKIRLRAGIEIVLATDWLKDNLAGIEQPALFMHGTDDKVAKPESSQIAYDAVASTDKELEFCNGLYHAVWLDPEYHETLGRVAAFFDRQAKAAGP